MEMAIVGERGQITLPKKYRETFGIKAKNPIIIDITSEGILIKPAIVIESRVFSDKDIEDFTEQDAISKNEKATLLKGWE